MRYLTDEDVKTLIKEDVLEQVTDEDDIKDEAEEMAISEITDYLNVKYDTAAIFNQSGSGRHKSILKYCIDIWIYHLHARVNPHALPDTRKDRYKEAVSWLKLVCRGDISPKGLPLPTDDTEKNWGLWSDPKFNSDY